MEMAQRFGMLSLKDFVIESNRIEGINREPAQAEIDAHSKLLGLAKLTTIDIEHFVGSCTVNDGEPYGAVLRRQVGMDVTVGGYTPPPGGANIEMELHKLLGDINFGLDPYEAHCRYESLHPFTDGNGRSGRAIWLWQMGPDGITLGFLHAFYYQTLRAQSKF